MSKQEQLENIESNLVNGNRQECVKLIDAYGLYEFWADYKQYLFDLYVQERDRYTQFTDMTISYFRIKNR